MGLIKAVVLGVIEGITEWLPISSTGHMILVNEFLRLSPDKAFTDLFLVVIQLGAILAVVIMYWERLFPFELSPFRVKKEIWVMWGKIVIASAPVAALGFAFGDAVQERLYNPRAVAAALIVFGFVFIIAERKKKAGKLPEKITETGGISVRTALAVGAFQACALVPGVSRSGASIVGGLLSGLSRALSAEFSFFLAIPAMAGASLLKMIKFGSALSPGEASMLITGGAAAFGVSVAAIRFMMRFIKKGSFEGFGWYRIALGLAVLAYFAAAR
ncbi:MAG: undecaprenyl-diphosphate phosphatase [Clostridiales bacterium]|jgi:undecaprenyl-diphosphatase|nr:undecaprenyl-diphosphate phosphatase [Clostridiales bacterium]